MRNSYYGVAYLEQEKIEKLKFESLWDNYRNIDRQKLVQVVLKAIDVFTTERERECIINHYIDKMTMSDIANRNGVNVSSVSKVIKRGIMKVKKNVEFTKWAMSL